MNTFQIIEEAEVLIFLGQFRAAANLLLLLSRSELRLPPVMVARLLVAQGLNDWESGLQIASKCLSSTDSTVRNAAAAFLHNFTHQTASASHSSRRVTPSQPSREMTPSSPARGEDFSLLPLCA